MSSKGNGRVGVGQVWGGAELAKQRLAHMVDVQAVIFTLGPIRIVPKTVYSYIFECRIVRKPCLRPVVGDRARLAPCLPRAAAEAMDEDEVDEGFRGTVKKVQSRGPFWIVHAVIGGTSNYQREGGRCVAAFAPKAQNRLSRK